MHVTVDIIPRVKEEDFLEELEETAVVSEDGESRKRKRVHEEQEDTDEHSSSSKSMTSRASSTSTVSTAMFASWVWSTVGKLGFTTRE